MSKKIFRSNRLAANVAAVVMAVAANSAVADAEKYAVDIAAQQAGSALVALGESMGVQVTIPNHLASNVTLNSVKGEFTLGEALERLLIDTGLTYQITADQGVVISSETSAENGESLEEDLEEIVVTGTRLKQGNPTARVEVITSEEIDARGLSSAEDVIRSIPQNFSSINGSNNLNNNSEGFNTGFNALGMSTANLRGLGSRNTLVLVNGRRISGAGFGDGEFTANIRDIPASAIDRVEVNLNGGSAVYGSDGLGGIINIILKEDYQDGLLTADFGARKEFSNTGADRERLNASFAYGWGDGGLRLNISQTETDSVDTLSTGFTTLDHSSRFGGSSDADFRNPATGSLNVTRVLVPPPPGPPAPSTPSVNPDPAFDGTSVDPADYRPATVFDVINGPVDRNTAGETSDQSISLNVNHQLTDSFNLRAEAFYTKAETTSVTTSGIATTVEVPDSNAFNNFGSSVDVTYVLPESGAFPVVGQFSESTQKRYVVGFDWDITDDWRLVFDYNKSESERFNNATSFGTLTQTRIDETALPSQREELQALYDAQQAALMSSDPATAVNLFSNGPLTNAAALNPFFFGVDTINSSELESFSGYVTGSLWELPAGTLDVVVGFERREDTLTTPTFMSTSFVDIDNPVEAVPAPVSKYEAWYAEFSAPLVENVSWAERVVLTGSVRYDGYEATGSTQEQSTELTFLPGPPFVQVDRTVGPLESQTVDFNETSFGAGVRWDLNDELSFTASYNESFRAPSFDEVFGRQSDFIGSGVILDPLLEAAGLPPVDPSQLQTLRSSSNVDLEPETAENIAFGVTYTPNWAEALVVQLDYSKLDYTNRITSTGTLRQFMSLEEYGNRADIFVRPDPTDTYAGTDIPVARLQNTYSINIAETVTESLDLDVSYGLDTDFGSFQPGLTVAYILTQEDALFSGATPVDNLGTTRGIDQYKVQARLDWTSGPASVFLRADYTPSYTNLNFRGTARGFDPVTNPDGIPEYEIDSYLTVSATFNYDWDNGLTTIVGARNLFNEEFPFALSASGNPVDASRVDTRGRVLFAEIRYALGQ